ncbi:hypothetical protein [Corynebacterium uterequi]|uniref:LemA family protein n=1 Tax=Corynebacterium uterequi TaxID=1072256 RepID=A0A0G3HD03_9CORY|nr:hypothetical protein [Corynebacterium uterequi]AKK11241.1 hypothetical protein CUTER_06225 [Corynebacterium uterequi]
MSASTLALIALVAAVSFIVAWAFHLAQRLHRLHIRTDQARMALMAALDRRAAVVAALIPEASAAAREAESLRLDSASPAARLAAEAAMAQARREAATGTHPLLGEADVRVELAARFYHAAVTDTRAVRHHPLVRLLRLAGTAPLPDFYDLSEVVSTR